MNAGSDLLTALYQFEDKQLWQLARDITVATTSLAVVYFTFAVLWARFRKSRNLLRWQVFVPILFLVLVAQAVFLYSRNPIVSREQFVFIPMPSVNSFATLAIFTEIPDRLHQDQNGILHVYARAYYSTKPEDIAGVRGSVDSHWLGLSKVAQHDVQKSIFGKTRGTDLTYEYRPDSLGRHALHEQFAIDVRGRATRNQTYVVDTVETVDVVKPFPLSEILTNSSVLQIFVPLLLTVFGLSAKPKTKSTKHPVKTPS